MSISPASEPLPTSFVLKRRLIGLLVLLLFLFLLSVLLRGLGQPRENREDGLQTVVVPLGNSELPPVVAAPEPEAPADESASEPEPPAEIASAAAPEAEPIRSAPAPAPAPAKESAPKPAADPVPAKPVKPAAEKPVAKVTPPAPPPKAPAAAARWYVVLGSFSDAANAKALALRARQSGFKAEVLPMKSGASTLNRVRVGPFKSDTEGNSARATLIVEGMTGAKLVKEP